MNKEQKELMKLRPIAKNSKEAYVIAKTINDVLRSREMRAYIKEVSSYNGSKWQTEFDRMAKRIEVFQDALAKFEKDAAIDKLSTEEVYETIVTELGNELADSRYIDWQHDVYRGKIRFSWTATFRRMSGKEFYDSNKREVNSKERTMDKIQKFLEDSGRKVKRIDITPQDLDQYTEYSEYEQSLGGSITTL